MQDDISLGQFVIPSLTRNPSPRTRGPRVWTPAPRFKHAGTSFAGMTSLLRFIRRCLDFQTTHFRQEP